MGIIARIRSWLKGTNVCPRCKGITYRMSFGIHRDLCPDCYDEVMVKRNECRRKTL